MRIPPPNRAWAGALLAALSALIVCAGLRDVPGVAALRERLRPAIAVLGLDQSWQVFAPHPRTTGIRIEAVIRWSDGARTTWRPPSGNAISGAYTDYRWRKWSEHASSDAAGPRLLPAAARYVARRLPPRAGASAVELQLIRYTQPVPPPGTSPVPRWQATVVYRARLAPQAR